MNAKEIRLEQTTRTDESLRAGVAAVAAEGQAAGDWCDELLRSLRASLAPPPRIDCSDGCAHCCHVEVTGTFPEMASLAAHVLANFTAAERVALTARLDEHCQRLEAMSPDVRSGTSIPCVLLAAGHCSAYGGRPLACRGWNSADVSRCEQATAERGAQAGVPVHTRLRDTAFAVSLGIQDSCGAALCDDAPLDLPSALRYILADAALATSRWLAGEALPASIVSREGSPFVRDADGLFRLRVARAAS